MQPSPIKVEPKATPSLEEGDVEHFSVGAFQRAITENDLEIAVKELNKCHGKADELARVYNGIGSDADVNQTPLFHILHPNVRRGETSDAKKLLEHPSMRKVVLMKWKNFGLANYMEQLLLYLLLLMTMTLSVIMDRNVVSPKYALQLLIWLNIATAIGVTLVMLHLFRYTKRYLWAVMTAAVLGGALAFLNLFMGLLQRSIPWLYFVWANNLVLGAMGVYFLRFELHEMFAEVASHNRRSGLDTPWLLSHPAIDRALYYCIYCPIAIVMQFVSMLLGANEAKYFDSHFNKVQLPTFMLLLVYVLHECFTPDSDHFRLVVGTILTLLLWVLGLQYLEVHATAGYLIPMMRNMLGDVFNFLALYLPFQCAYACAYYALFQGSAEAHMYDSVVKSSVTTYLVMLGEIDLEPFETLEDTTQYVVGYVLLLSHATIVIVMLLNVLIAMMAKTVDGGLDMAKLEALVSFAECVLRSEMTQGLRVVSAHDDSEAAMLLQEESSEMASDEPDFSLDGPSAAESLTDLKNDMAVMQAKMDQMLAMMHTMQARQTTYR
ncbi:hypothetical protein SPRG_10912 [Saprolegnia parasitica CBS 223.65]|uniref:Ion transport domain-containing protein n=1 Tax=Saprolegnia parasitica (strain CBS 223.65) TaxID=695850 RepID=A0A067C025_SAPPC|nr:hypothetical protein SPRG_10912 [Saprolegnia parasitica CBS 223.65]KDO24124.1 hypothetical protein SPRG_10912 [Saprolegnia parasitica CBS 223.65]|eukprot:XP_012205259.1 hypothetical protein SPRG_10912 [Saprolegnia parasitica CBS 223.65]